MKRWELEAGSQKARAMGVRTTWKVLIRFSYISPHSLTSVCLRASESGASNLSRAVGTVGCDETVSVVGIMFVGSEGEAADPSRVTTFERESGTGVGPLGAAGVSCHERYKGPQAKQEPRTKAAGLVH